MSRANTLVFALLVLNSLLGVLCLVVARGERKSSALKLWGWGLLTYSAGLLITIPAFLPFGPRKIVGNALIAFTPILTVAGLLRHTRWRLHRQWTVAGLAASVLPIVFNHTLGRSLPVVDLLAPAPIANVLFVIAAVALLRDPPSDARAAARFLAGILIASVAVWTARMTLLWLSLGASPDRDRADLTISLFVIAQLVIAVSATLGLFWVEVRKMEADLKRLADTDPLTGLPNRRATVERFGQEAARAERHGRPFALVVFDLDFFKKVNDTHGHLAGDALLRHVAGVLSAGARAVDVVGRIGGEEFVCLLGEERADGAAQAADRLRESVAAAPLALGESEMTATVSGGLAIYPSDGTTWDDLFGAADGRLYEAKSRGRNRVEGPARALRA